MLMASQRTTTTRWPDDWVVQQESRGAGRWLVGWKKEKKKEQKRERKKGMARRTCKSVVGGIALLLSRCACSPPQHLLKQPHDGGLCAVLDVVFLLSSRGWLICECECACAAYR